jgi:hypothetical protein
VKSLPLSRGLRPSTPSPEHNFLSTKRDTEAGDHLQDGLGAKLLKKVFQLSDASAQQCKRRRQR